MKVRMLCLVLLVVVTNSIAWQKNYNSGGVVADETAKDARTAHIQIHHDATHASTIQLPLRETTLHARNPTPRGSSRFSETSGDGMRSR